jgi:hypothetical protein
MLFRSSRPPDSLNVAASPPYLVAAPDAVAVVVSDGQPGASEKYDKADDGNDYVSAHLLSPSPRATDAAAGVGGWRSS